METLSGAALARPAPQAALSVEISHLVARVLKGETFDIAASGDKLAFRFPDAGMTGTMIAEAIERAAGMVGLIREGALPDAPSLKTEASPFDEQLAATIDAEIGEIVAGQAAEAARSDGGDAAGVDDSGAGKAENEPRTFTARGAVAAVRRALFRG